MKISKGGRVKTIEFSRGYAKSFRETVKSIGIPGGQLEKNIDILNMGEGVVQINNK